MFRVLLYIVAILALSWTFAFGRVVLGMVEAAPSVLTWVGLFGCVVLLGTCIFLLGFGDYKVEKRKGTVTRPIRFYEEALTIEAELRARRGEPPADPAEENV